MNQISASHVAATSGIVGNIAAIIVWLSDAFGSGHWFPIDSATSVAIASLLVSALGAGSFAAWRATLGNSGIVTDASGQTPPLAKS